MPPFDELEGELNRLDSRAELLKILPIDPEMEPAAAEAYKAQHQELIEAGADDDAESIRRVVNE